MTVEHGWPATPHWEIRAAEDCSIHPTSAYLLLVSLVSGLLQFDVKRRRFQRTDDEFCAAARVQLSGHHRLAKITPREDRAVQDMPQDDLRGECGTG